MTATPDADIALQKQALRSALRQARSAHVRQHRGEALQREHEALARHAPELLALTGLAAGQTPVIASFKAKGSEIDPTALEQALRQLGARLVWPGVEGEGLQFRTDEGSPPFVTGAHDLLEPNPLASQCEPDLILLPLVGFDGQGHRLGQGGGYYDRTLHRLGPGIAAIGLAYECQRCPQVPVQAHDVAMQGVITPAGMQVF